MAKYYLKTVFAELFYENKILPEPKIFPNFTHLVEFTVIDWFEVFDDSRDLSFERIDNQKIGEKENGNNNRNWI